ncbi:MAG TPA: hypothetical protein VHN77_07900 [Phycisphaerales bacterium]|nr:hypothetical protein [Phycisphaerales bacterium]
MEQQKALVRDRQQCHGVLLRVIPARKLGANRLPAFQSAMLQDTAYMAELAEQNRTAASRQMQPPEVEFEDSGQRTRREFAAHCDVSMDGGGTWRSLLPDVVAK